MLDHMSVTHHLRSIQGLERMQHAQPLEVQPTGRTDLDPVGSEGVGFKDLLAEEISKVNEQMLHADRAMSDLVAGRSGNVHETMIAMQKANVSFRMLLQVRNKVIKAYEEVMRTQV